MQSALVTQSSLVSYDNLILGDSVARSDVHYYPSALSFDVQFTHATQHTHAHVTSVQEATIDWLADNVIVLFDAPTVEMVERVKATAVGNVQRSVDEQVS